MKARYMTRILLATLALESIAYAAGPVSLADVQASGHSLNLRCGQPVSAAAANHVIEGDVQRGWLDPEAGNWLKENGLLPVISEDGLMGVCPFNR